MTETTDTLLAPDRPVDAAAAAVVSDLLTEATAVADAGIRPFSYHASDEDLADLRRRIEAVRWPEKELVDDQSQGVQLATMQALAAYWLNDYDWRRCEARLNALPELHHRDRRARHPLHPRPLQARGRPAADRHPRLAGLGRRAAEDRRPLTDPTAHGGTAADAFHLVIPSLPGYGFSGKPTATGWDPTASPAPGSC